MDSLKAFKAVVAPLESNLEADFDGLKNAVNHEWFSKNIAAFGLMAYLEFAPKEHFNQSMKSLAYAFKHAGTREALCQLCLGLFGLNSVIIIDESPNQISLKITNSNSNFNYTVANTDKALASNDKAIAGTSLKTFTDNDPLAFFKLFIPAGVVLTGLEIS
jgi:hypothetical protein